MSTSKLASKGGHLLQALEEGEREAGLLGCPGDDRGGQLLRVAHQDRAAPRSQHLQRHQRRRLHRLPRLRSIAASALLHLAEAPDLHEHSNPAPILGRALAKVPRYSLSTGIAGTMLAPWKGSAQLACGPLRLLRRMSSAVG